MSIYVFTKTKLLRVYHFPADNPWVPAGSYILVRHAKHDSWQYAATSRNLHQTPMISVHKVPVTIDALMLLFGIAGPQRNNSNPGGNHDPVRDPCL